ncbi:hypothetical protein DPMN_093090 [Dreissena polymorpha]|uniref:Uncharacterized protein n=1 Tax=Dreissena polymorpha TaxID=45954 RepID=A0A9D4R2A0_DREPO|nr:hypothetical protein DPMN_093090 [Dreissena polymorpha]
MARQRLTRIPTPHNWGPGVGNVDMDDVHYVKTENMGYEKKIGYEKNWVRKKNWEYGEVVTVDLSINLKQDGKQAAFTYINGPGWIMWTCMVEIDRVVIRDVQY